MMSAGIRSGVNCTRLVAKPEHDAQRLDQPALAEAGHADQQRVAAGQQRDQRLIDHLVLAEDHPSDRRTHPADARTERLDLGQDRWLGVDRALLRRQPY